jgi:hypothetical protein
MAGEAFTAMAKFARPNPILTMVEWLGGADVRLFFTNGAVVERALPGVKSARKARVIDEGLGLDPGDGGGDMSALMLYTRRGRKLYQLGDR